MKTKVIPFSDRVKIKWNGRVYTIHLDGEAVAYCFTETEAREYAAKYEYYGKKGADPDAV